MSRYYRPHLMGCDPVQGIRVASDFVAELQLHKRPIADFSFKTKSHQLASLNGIRIGKSIITEVVSDPAITRTLIDPHVSFGIQKFGGGKITEGTKSIQWAAPRQILRFTSDRERLNDYHKSSWIYIRPDLSALIKELGDNFTEQNKTWECLLTGGTTVVPNESNGVRYYDSLIGLFDIIGRSGCDSAFLARIGLDDVLHRLLAEMVTSQDSFKQIVPPHFGRSRREKAVHIVCEYIQQNIGTPLTISKMERLTGLTGRSLTYGFQERFGSSPQEWQRNLLLDEARKRLSDRRNTSSIKAIAYELGFSSSSSFGAHYKRRFHERPTETISLVYSPL